MFSWYLKQNSITVFLEVSSLEMVIIHLSDMTEMAIVVAFFFTSPRTYQQKSSTVISELESFLVEINLHKKKLLINCSYNPHKNIIGSHLNVITKTLDTYFGKYINVVFPEILMQKMKKLPWNLFLPWLPGYRRSSTKIDLGSTPI